ncbi:plasmid partitioning protein RepB C-terminal domain-containing protein [Bradyrhizobium canariense]|uniref:plasmid partitioning protein RepB C-terminal domain-containing protein n=1 Tax=Bradyrhizobium canariense TaxID=255045 RepID=UPI000A193270|nr:plasmid partitioning protein RepB C-terminal domain-containing protein [Bradyrhizobium canariense]OSI34584.1 chromosome partitioning protein ParB [Bradyrhizobium canariense]OSI40221.1 chromosome partitioning protein ParB [Bradyrhizobium canariense]OSI56549.1 chromosome partitioning protein ParB [Bradyrhizobium canariense]OSI58214.1 chromosome partitioning protein ParB [Bradyrhizobium canariense]OSI61505.1 chromosome partitioning protein ParB [Bradyrhizobium canariense]
MTGETAPTIVDVPVADIRVINPRSRNKRVFGELVTSIAHLGLKKPITVSHRNGHGYDLVCGQGRLEAFIALGQKEIPAIVIEASEEDCFVMSLVENLARRHHSPLELVSEIGNLKKRGYSMAQIAAKIDFSTEYVYAICYLLENGEQRLLAAVDKGLIPHTIAMEIAKAKDGDVQKALAEAYESNAIPGNQVLTIRKIIEQRNLLGRAKTLKGPRHQKRVTSGTLVRAFRKEADRQKLLVKKAGLAQGRLLFVVNALRMLMGEAQFVKLLRTEELHTLPRPIAERLHTAGG